MNQLRDDIATCRALYVEMMARCHDMLARCDNLEDCLEVAEIRAEVLAMASKLETSLNYWLCCLEASEGMAHGRKRLH